MSDQNDKLVVIWTSGDRDVAIRASFMYSYNSKLRGWWNDVCFIVWGPSAKLLAEDTELHTYIRGMLKIGVVVEACKKCADEYGVSDQLAALGIDVKYMGEPLTEYLKEGRKVITF